MGDANGHEKQKREYADRIYHAVSVNRKSPTAHSLSTEIRRRSPYLRCLKSLSRL
jgi:hypothetical protein